MATTPNYGWPIPDPTNPPNVPQDMGNLGKAQDTTVKNIDNRVAAAEAKNTAQDNRFTAVESKNTAQDNAIGGLDSRMRRAELVLRGNLKFFDFDPPRVINSNTMTELPVLAQTLTIPDPIPAHATHYLIHVMMNISTAGHDGFRFGAQFDDRPLFWYDTRPVGVPFDTSGLVYAVYDVPLDGKAPGDYPLSYWARNGTAGTRTDIGAARMWATLV